MGKPGPKPKTMETTCAWCRKAILLSGWQRLRAIKRGYFFCGRVCSGAAKSAKSTGKNTGRKATAETRAKIGAKSIGRTHSAEGKERLRRLGKEAWHAGRLRPYRRDVPTPMEALLLAQLPGWTLHHRVPGVPGRRGGYEIDLAHLGAKIAVEVDGDSHDRLVAKARDARKTELLVSRGWWVVRIPHRSLVEFLRLHVESCKMMAKVLTDAS
jgi:very-short-patch-repair endonuclease